MNVQKNILKIADYPQKNLQKCKIRRLVRKIFKIRKSGNTA